jgi:hypothetical protein
MLGRSVTFLFTGRFECQFSGRRYGKHIPKYPDSNASSLGGASKHPNNVMLFGTMLRLMLRKKGLCYVTKRSQPA